MLKMNENIMLIELPQGYTMAQLNDICKAEIKAIIDQGLTYGKDICINGRVTTAMAMLLGHELAHVCKSVSVFDPKEGVYIPVITH